MGTNYYAQADVECPECGEKHLCRQGLHLGKSSFGWQFLFAFNGGEFYKDVPTMRKFIEGKNIYDEYNKPISHSEFWQMVDKKQSVSNPESSSEYILDIGGYRFMEGEFS